MILPNTQSPLQTIWSQKAWPKKMQSNASHKSRIVGMRRSDAEEDEFYETNPDDFIILLDQMKRDGIELSHKIWEPSCGHGALSEELSIRGHNVLSSDLIPRGYGNTSDFLFQHTTLDGTKLPSKIRRWWMGNNASEDTMVRFAWKVPFIPKNRKTKLYLHPSRKDKYI